MNRSVVWERTAQRQMQALSQRQPTEAARIAAAVQRFATETVGDVKKLQGERPTTWRLRVGDWRVRFRLERDTMLIVAVKIRRDAYD